jgi:hypothetical protein
MVSLDKLRSSETGVHLRGSRMTRRRILPGHSAAEGQQSDSWIGNVIVQYGKKMAYEKFHFRNLLIHFFHKLDYEINQLVFQHRLRVEIGDEEGDIIALVIALASPNTQICDWYNSEEVRTFTGFLRKMKKDSARCVKNRVNLCTNMLSISSACFMRMLTRTLLTLGSMKTFSFSLRATVKGLSKSSGELAASISGTLCRSDVCDAKLDTARAAVRDDRTHWRYGRRD